MKLNNKKCETSSREKDGAKLFDGGGLCLELDVFPMIGWKLSERDQIEAIANLGNVNTEMTAIPTDMILAELARRTGK